MSWWHEFHFLRVYWLLGLFIPIAFLWMAAKNEKIQSSWADVCDEHLLKFLLIKGNHKQRRFSYFLAVLIMVLMFLALSGPTWQKKQFPALSVDNPVVIALNMSSDMWQNDVAPSRGERAKYLIKDMLKSFKTMETALMVYSREPFIISPFTEDVLLIDNLLSALERDIMPENGDRLDRAIDLAVERLKETGYNKGNIVILTSDVGERFDAALESAINAHNQGFDVNVIKISSKQNDKLQMIAQKGNGFYINYDQSLSDLSRKINDVVANELKKSQNMQSVWEDMGYYILWLPALLMLFYFRKGFLIALFLFLNVPMASANMFLNDNQQAMKYFSSGDYAKASATFKNTKWKAAAAYKAGDYDGAYENFAAFNDVTSLYNQGNALAKAGKIDEAIKKYEEVLKQKPDFEDAEFNLEYLKKQQQQQKQNQQQEQKQDKNQQKQNQNKNQQEQNQKEENQQQNSAQADADNKQDEKKENADEKNSANDKQNAQQDRENEDNDKRENEKNYTASEDNSNNKGMQTSPENENQDTTSDNESNKNSPQSAKEQKQENASSTDVEQKTHYGNENENGKEAEAIEAQAGNKSSEDMEKIRSRLQKFREIPEDKGGLLRAIIEREYKLNRYNNK